MFLVELMGFWKNVDLVRRKLIIFYLKFCKLIGFFKGTIIIFNFNRWDDFLHDFFNQ